MGVILRLLRKVNDALSITSIVVSHDVDEIALVADLSYILAGRQSGGFGQSKRIERR